MKIKLTLIGAALTVLCLTNCSKPSATRGEATAEPGGWRDAHWGMTMDEISKFYPMAKKSAFKDGEPRLEIDEFAIGRDKGTVFFRFDKAGKLEGVTVNFVPSASDDFPDIKASSTEENLRELLQEKYGAPFYSNVEATGSTFSWRGIDVQIILALSRGPSEQVFLFYSKPDRDALSKL